MHGKPYTLDFHMHLYVYVYSSRYVCLCFLCPFCLALSFWSVALACYHSRLLWDPLGVFEYEYAPLQCGQHIGLCEINALNSIRPGYQGICHRPVRQTLLQAILTHLNKKFLRLEMRCLKSKLQKACKCV